MSDPRTPRDWLLERHRDAAPALDEMRRALLSSIAPRTSQTVGQLLAAIFRPHRAAWGALAALWVVLAAAVVVQQQNSRGPIRATPPPETFSAWLGQLKSHALFAQNDHRP